MPDGDLPPLFNSTAADNEWIASDVARGPWDARHCHGGPVSAFLARACEQVDDGSIDWQISRLTIELTRPVPVGEPLALRTDVERPGKKVSLVGAALSVRSADGGNVDVARARALRVRRSDIELPPHPLAPIEMVDPPDAGRPERVTWADNDGQVAFHSHGAEHRIVRGGWDDPGPIQVWIRLRTGVVADETPSGVQRAAAAADFGNGVSSALSYDDFLYINPDLTMHLARPPVGEWIGLASHSVYGTATHSTGSGFAESALHDAEGRVGRSVQSLFVDQR